MEKIACTLCHSTQIEWIPNKIRNDINEEYKMYRCANCETHFLYPKPQNEELVTYYDGRFREEVHTAGYYDYEVLKDVFDRFMPEAMQRVLRVKRELQPSDDILEIGCSVGYFMDAVADYVHNVYGTEWDIKAQQYIRSQINRDNIQVGSNPEDFGRKFDKIFMFHVLEHIGDPITFLTGLKQVLNHGGKIYIEVPNVDDVLVKTYACDAFKDYYYKKAHLYNFNKKGLAYIFKQAGFCYQIDFIQRYDLSNHLYWLHKGLPGGKGLYSDLLGNEVNEEYVRSLQNHGQTDTLFASIWV